MPTERQNLACTLSLLRDSIKLLCPEFIIIMGYTAVHLQWHFTSSFQGFEVSPAQVYVVLLFHQHISTSCVRFIHISSFLISLTSSLVAQRTLLYQEQDRRLPS